MHVQSCGHVVHLDCFEQFMKSRANRQDPDEKLMDTKVYNI